MSRDVFQTTITEHQMLCKGDGVVAALSGGPDSTALLCLLLDVQSEWQLRIHGAHLNHGLRGAEADRDEVFVREQCRRLGVPLTSARAGAPPESENLEQWAREARYGFLQQVRSDLGFGKIATGHTRNDLAETFLMRLLRGSGLTGLACLRPVREGGLIRPMIALTRENVLAYVEQCGEPFREDSSNLDTGRIRNRLRHELIPLLERKYNPRIIERLAVTADLVRDDEDRLASSAASAMEQLSVERGEDGSLTVGCADLLGLPAALARRIVRQVISECQGQGHLRRIDRSHVEAVLRLAASGDRGEKRMDLPGTIGVRAAYGKLVIGNLPRPEVPERWSVALEIPGRTLFEPCGLEILATIGPGPDVTAGWPDPRTTVLLDAEAASIEGLVLRSCRPGDRYCPAGAPGRRKLGRMLIDDRVPRQNRQLVPVLTAGDEPIWLPGRLPAAGWCWLADSGAACLRIDLHQVQVHGRGS